MPAKKNSLGKGLANIYGEELYDVINELENSGLANQIAIEKIRPNPYQPRKSFNTESLKELAESIATHGIFTPLLVREAVNGYELIAGERRLRAAKLAGLSEVPAIVAEFNDQQMMEISLLENIQREDLNALEEATAYDRLIETFNYSHEALADRVHKSRVHISNTLRLLKLPKSIQKLIADGHLSAGQARPLITLENKSDIESLAQKIVLENLSVRQVEALVASYGKTSVKKNPKRKDYMLAEELLSKKLQTSVSIAAKKIVIKFRDNADLNRILEELDCLED